jgi:Raf kinase inhibitor-like YbhB/YbcL family protein
VRLTLVVVIVSSLLSGCGLLRGSTVVANAPAVMTVSSSAFVGNVLPQRYTCHGTKVTSPPLTWAGAPSATRSFALIVDDSSAPISPYIYWIVFDINQATSSIPQGQLPSGAREAQGSDGVAAYNPPCPSGSHSYRFTVYALNKSLDLPAGTSLNKAVAAIAAATIGRGRIPVKTKT